MEGPRHGGSSSHVDLPCGDQVGLWVAVSRSFGTGVPNQS
jgi:hypothetical protein